MSQVESGPNGSVVSRADGIDQIKQELRQKEHAYPNGKPRPLGRIARWARIGLLAKIAALVLQTALLALYYFAPSVLPPIFFKWGEDGFNAGYLFDGLFVISTYFTFFMVARFTYRAMKNLFTMGSPIAAMPPGWTVGWYFVPIASLWQPAMGMSQIYRGTHEAVGEKPPVGSPVLVWWLCNLFSSVPGIVLRFWPGSIVMQFSMSVAAAALSAIAAWTLYGIILRVTGRQETFQQGGVATVFD